ncbi:hypothetical protein RFI_03019 [Reticulomyxa filosa]|uniref:Uncharacterized protein n=1 Tax=Reticulomyxa filosa TaxID=46433 RepID=X6P7N2_RETFI|nr:hypothetical protein RFI_03019 [Reticulomyxa filosa]|eukprot:ETO34074.1 hypothetical protein RFI_03019 [Reticulomyxa filosa]
MKQQTVSSCQTTIQVKDGVSALRQLRFLSNLPSLYNTFFWKLCFRNPVISFLFTKKRVNQISRSPSKEGQEAKRRESQLGKDGITMDWNKSTQRLYDELRKRGQMNTRIERKKAITKILKELMAKNVSKNWKTKTLTSWQIDTKHGKKKESKEFCFVLFFEKTTSFFKKKNSCFVGQFFVTAFFSPNVVILCFNEKR